MNSPSLLPYHFTIIARLAALPTRRMRRIDLAEELGIADRTLERSLRRYVRFVNDLPDDLPASLPMLRMTTGRDRRAWVELVVDNPIELDNVWRFAALRLASERLAPEGSEPVSDWLRQFEQRVHYHAPAPTDDHDTGAIAALMSGLLGNRCVALAYGSTDEEGSENRHTFEPWSLVVHAGDVFVLGSTPDDGATPAIIDLATVTKAVLLDETFEVPPGFDPDTYFAHRFGPRDGVREHVVLAFEPGLAANMSKRVWPGFVAWRRHEDGRQVLELDVEITDDLLGWLRRWGADVEILEPASLRARFAADVAAVNARYDEA